MSVAMGGKQVQTLPVTLGEGEFNKSKISAGPMSTINAGGATGTQFESYISKVISSVQNRKKNPRLKSLFNNTGSNYHTLEPNAQG